MENCYSPAESDQRVRIQPVVCALALAVAFTVSLPQSAHAGHITPPPVPGDIQVPAEVKAFLEGHAFGTQNYVCVPAGAGFAWSLFTPQATLLNDHDRQVTTHFFGPNPLGTVLAARKYSRDMSTVWGQATGISIRPRLRRAGRDSLAPGRQGFRPGRTYRRRHVVGDDPHPSGEHRWRGCALYSAAPCRRTSARGRSYRTPPTTSSTGTPTTATPTATRTRATRISTRGLRRDRMAQPFGSGAGPVRPVPASFPSVCLQGRIGHGQAARAALRGLAGPPSPSPV